jgi:hypothetical protein
MRPSFVIGALLSLGGALSVPNPPAPERPFLPAPLPPLHVVGRHEASSQPVVLAITATRTIG